MKIIFYSSFIVCFLALGIASEFFSYSKKESGELEKLIKITQGNENYSSPCLVSDNNNFTINGYISDFAIIKFLAFINERKNSKNEINLFLNTSGGKHFPSIALGEYLHQFERKINIYVLDQCFHSGMEVLARTNGKRYAFNNSSFYLVYFKYKDGIAQVLDESKINFWKQFSRFPANIDVTRNFEKHYSANEMKQMGVIDEIIIRKR